MSNIIDGRKIADKILDEVAKDTAKLKDEHGITPSLAVVLVGHDPASEIYVSRKQEACEKTGMHSHLHRLDDSASEKELIDLVTKLNNDPSVHGILVQLPLPDHIEDQKIIELIDPEKDVDGFHPYNLARLVQQHPLLRPCTSYGIMQIIEQLNIHPENTNAVIVGSSNIVGRPMAMELLLANYTVTICHRHTKNLAEHVKNADLLVSAVGKPHLIKGDWIKEGAVVFDVGITRLDSGKLAGDIEFEKAKDHASWITPVPGGVGPVTVAVLLQNTAQAAKNSIT